MSIYSPTSSSLKISICGDKRVGKTWLASCLCDKLPPADYISTIGVDYRAHHFSNKCQKWCIWDLAGSLRFQPLTYAYVYGAKVLLYVYDATNKRSLRELQSRHQRYIKEQGRNTLGQIIIVGTNIDKLANDQDPVDGTLWAEQLGARHFYISSKTRENIRPLQLLLESMIPPIKTPKNEVHLENTNIKHCFPLCKII